MIKYTKQAFDLEVFLLKKFAFIGAGSLQFTSSCMRDLLTFPLFADCHIALMDINPVNLEGIAKVCEKIKKEMECPKCTITVHNNRAEALKDADGVLCTVFNGDVDVWKNDIEIPLKYGININVGDTRSVSGIFRALRTIPVLQLLTNSNSGFPFRSQIRFISDVPWIFDTSISFQFSIQRMCS